MRFGRAAWVAFVGAAWFALPDEGPLSARILGIVALAIVFAHERIAPRWTALAGALVAALAFVAPTSWFAALVALGIASVPERRARIALGVGIGLPLAFYGVVSLAGGGALVTGALATALPREAALVFARDACRTVVALGALRALDVRGPLGASLALGAVGLALARAVTVLSYARTDGELYWPEAPMLVNALKLANHEVLYGDPAALDSYSYSPLLDVVHRALLRPFGLELELFAHRALVLGDQLAAFAILAWAVRPSLARAPVAVRAAGLGLLAFAAFSNLIAPAVHPDHPLLVCFAVAVAITIAGERLPSRVRDVLFVLVTPAATGFKLSGAGIGLGLAIVTALRFRRAPVRRDLALLALSGVLTVATIPLFDRLFGRFSFYAITLQKSHPMEWSHFLAPPWPSFGAFALGVLALFVALLALERRSDARARWTNVFALTAAMALFSLPAAAKYAGRDNNFAVAFAGGVTLLVLAAAELPRLASPALGLALWGTLLTRPPSLPVSAAERASIARGTAAMSEVVRADARAGERTLLLVPVLPWLRAGRTDVPRDRWHSAIELYYGRLPEGDLLRARIADGRYRTIIASGDELALRLGPAQAFQAGIADALTRAYVELSRSAEPPRARVYVRKASK